MNYLNSQLLYKNHIFAGFGNPLIDISAIIKSDEILNQFNLKSDGQREVSDCVINQILRSLESSNHEVTKNPGGCAQNTLRIIQALIKQPDACLFFGGLGGDSDGVFLETEVRKCGVETRYAIHSEYTTGKVAALIHGNKRSLVAHLGAAELYRMEDFSTPENVKLLKEVLLVYIEGFFITHSLDVALEIIKICRDNGVIVAFNISGAYVADTHGDKLLAVITLADIIIGNDAEIKALGRTLSLKASPLVDLALETYLFLCEKNSGNLKYKLKHMKDLGKILITTRGEEPIICVYGNKKVVEFPVPKLDVDLIKDTTGAGDSFAAAFLVAFIQGKPMTECLAFGSAIAQKVIQQVGVFLPSE